MNLLPGDACWGVGVCWVRVALGLDVITETYITETVWLQGSGEAAAALEARLAAAEAARDEAVRGVAERDSRIAQLDEAVVTLRDGPGAGLMKAWDTERQELLQDVEAAEDRIMALQRKVRPATQLAAQGPPRPARP